MSLFLDKNPVSRQKPSQNTTSTPEDHAGMAVDQVSIKGPQTITWSKLSAKVELSLTESRIVNRM